MIGFEIGIVDGAECAAYNLLDVAGVQVYAGTETGHAGKMWQ